jgi:hypothetical protein
MTFRKFSRTKIVKPKGSADSCLIGSNLISSWNWALLWNLWSRRKAREPLCPRETIVCYYDRFTRTSQEQPRGLALCSHREETHGNLQIFDKALEPWCSTSQRLHTSGPETVIYSYTETTGWAQCIWLILWELRWNSIWTHMLHKTVAYFVIKT